MIFKLFVKQLFILTILVFSFSVKAKTLVLVHGFTADGMSWRTTNFTKPLLAAGWKDGGGYGYSPQSMLLARGALLKCDVFFTVELPSKETLQIQESLLAKYLTHLYSQRREPISLAGHSAGGVVARLYVLNPARQPVNALITIASPHLGTPAANIAHLAGNSPIGFMTSMIGGDTLQNARGLFSDLKEEEPYNFLYWMNRQPHPDIHYASIIRNNKSLRRLKQFDFIVPPESQNMNNILALKNRSGVAHATQSHSLNSKDGLVVLDVLRYIK